MNLDLYINIPFYDVAIRVIAIKDYNPISPNQLRIRNGEILTILNENCEGEFSQAKNSKDEYGLLHSTFFQKLCDDNGKWFDICKSQFTKY